VAAVVFIGVLILILNWTVDVAVKTTVGKIDVLSNGEVFVINDYNEATETIPNRKGYTLLTLGGKPIHGNLGIVETLVFQPKFIDPQWDLEILIVTPMNYQAYELAKNSTPVLKMLSNFEHPTSLYKVQTILSAIVEVLNLVWTFVIGLRFVSPR
jgi:hypothetical protein